MIIVASHAFDQFCKAGATVFIPTLLILQLLFEECRPSKAGRNSVLACQQGSEASPHVLQV